MAAPRFPKTIAVLHAPPLPGSPGVPFGEDPSYWLEKVGEKLVKEARLFAKEGFDALILENFGDVPFYKDSVPAETVAAMSILSAAIQASVRIPLGINILRNDGRSALAVAAVSGASFIRVNVWAGLAATDQGLVEGQAAFLARERVRLYSSVQIFADIHVKHAITYSSVKLEDALEDTIRRGQVDAAIVSGAGTGKAVDVTLLKNAHAIARNLGRPLYLGSGVSREFLESLSAPVSFDGAIVSSDLRDGGQAGAPVSVKRIRDWKKAFARVVAKASIKKSNSSAGPNSCQRVSEKKPIKKSAKKYSKK